MEQSTLQEKLRLIPSVDKLMSDEHLAGLRKLYSDEIVKRMVRAALDELRKEIAEGKASQLDFTPESLAVRVERILHQRVGKRLMPVINATGVIVHTNLGRSPLSRRVADKIVQAAMSYSNLEYNLEQGRRGERNAHLRQIMLELTAAEAVLAVNNNAAAVLLALDSLARGREVIVSRGELIEIGGSLRIPDVMAKSGAILREVGTTNRTHPNDYIQAINENTALILKVHPSNYRIVGFTREVELDELVSHRPGEADSDHDGSWKRLPRGSFALRFAGGTYRSGDPGSWCRCSEFFRRQTVGRSTGWDISRRC